MAAYLVALDNKGSHSVISRHCKKLTDLDVVSRQGSTLPFGASYKIIQIVDQSILWSFLLAMLALVNFEMLEKGGRNIVFSLKEKQCSYHVDYKSKLVQLKHSLKFMNKLCNTINMHRLSDGLTFALRSEVDTTKTTFIGRVMRRYGIKDMFLPCDLLRDILTEREHLHCSRRLTHFKGAILRQILDEFLKDSNLFCGKAVDKALGKQGRYIMRRLNVAILLVPKTADKKFVDIELNDIALCWFSPCSMTLLSINFGSISAPWQRTSLTTELSKEVRRLCVRSLSNGLA
ncbi:hypothetical protein CQW23_31539 [Capsicum baccatum]|uniref:Uncharacterized protein n=1 Tax=Capsicum baccatum TaxID=33114 RepID=A0A2G2V799_CAPBA|nr:hypothetical protein CQW23_31539 [Capsicum baccatum]